jgi:hypothetical protein
LAARLTSQQRPAAIRLDPSPLQLPNWPVMESRRGASAARRARPCGRRGAPASDGAAPR